MCNLCLSNPSWISFSCHSSPASYLLSLLHNIYYLPFQNLIDTVKERSSEKPQKEGKAEEPFCNIFKANFKKPLKDPSTHLFQLWKLN